MSDTLAERLSAASPSQLGGPRPGRFRLTLLGAGLLLGIAFLWGVVLWLLFDSTVSGVVTALADAVGWRGVIVLGAAILTLCLALMLRLDQRTVAARRAAERAVQMRDLLAAALNGFPAGVQIKDAALRYVWVNDAHRQAIQHTADHLVDRTVAELGLDPALVEQVTADDRRVLETGQTIGPVEQWVPGPDGQQMTMILVTKAPLVQDGKVTHVLTFAVEMPAWRETRTRLEEARRLLQTVMDAAPITIQVVDREMRLRWANRAFLDTFGLQGASPLGKTLMEAGRYDDIVAEAVAYNRDLLSGRRQLVQIEQHYAATADGPERDLLVLKVPVRGENGVVEQILTIGTDVTALKRAEAEADRANRLIESILHAVPLSLQVKDTDLRYQWANRFFAAAMRTDPASIIGKTINEMMFTPEAKARMDEMDRTVLATGETIRFEDRWVDDGIERVMSVTKVPIRDNAGLATHVLTVADDVTLEHNLRAEAETANRLIEGILQNVPLSIQVKDRDLRYRWANRSFAEAIRREVADLIGRTVHDLDVPDFAKQRTDEQDRTVLATGETISFDERWVRDRVYRQMMVIKAPMLDSTGRVTHVITIGADVSELFRLRAEADEARRMLQQVVDAVPVTIALKDRERRYVWVNREFERILGRIAAAQVIGLRVEDVIKNPELAEEVRLSDEAMLETGGDAPPISQQLPDVNGVMRDYSVRRVAMRDASGAVEGILVVGVDVTDLLRVTNELRQVNAALEQRAAERARELAKVNELVSAVLECAPIPIMTLGLDGRFTSWNPAAERVIGFSAAEAMGGSLVPRSPERQADLIKILQRIRQGESFSDMEIRRSRKQGGEVELLLSGAPLRNADGQIEGVVLICLDITEQRATARQLQQAQKMEAVGQLTGGIAHDFNNLLAVVIGALDLLMLDLPAGSDARSLVRQAIEAAERGADLTARLLAFARRQSLRPAPTDVDALVRDMMPILQRAVGDAIAIRRTTDADLWPALVDRSQLESAILNLVVNARDAMPEGGCLTIATHNAPLDAAQAAEIPDAVPGHYVAVTVTDTGSGIAPEVIGKVFEPFFTTKPVGTGSGLGLSMVLGFVKQSGGNIRLASTPGQGTTVSLYLPRTSGAAGAGASRADTVQGNGETILLVEDDHQLRRISAAAVRALGYRVLMAPDASTALAELESHPEIALLFSDVVLAGGRNGFDLAREALRRRPGLPVLFASGFADSAVPPDRDLGGRFDLLAKPYRREDLAAKLHATLHAPAASGPNVGGALSGAADA